MRIDSSLASDLSRNTDLAGRGQGQGNVPNIRVSFDPVTSADVTLSGMQRYMLRQLGVGANVNLLA